MTGFACGDWRLAVLTGAVNARAKLLGSVSVASRAGGGNRTAWLDCMLVAMTCEAGLRIRVEHSMDAFRHGCGLANVAGAAVNLSDLPGMGVASDVGMATLAS